MKKDVIIEPTQDGYWAYIPELEGCTSFGETFEEVKKNIAEAVELHVEYSDEKIDVSDLKFNFKMDVRYFFEHYPVTISGIAKYSGINRSLLNQYSKGIKFPSEKQARRIQESIRNIGKELVAIRLG